MAVSSRHTRIIESSSVLNKLIVYHTDRVYSTVQYIIISELKQHFTSLHSGASCQLANKLRSSIPGTHHHASARLVRLVRRFGFAPHRACGARAYTLAFEISRRGCCVNSFSSCVALRCTDCIGLYCDMPLTCRKLVSVLYCIAAQLYRTVSRPSGLYTIRGEPKSASGNAHA